ncbi:MAG: TIGR02757 family protein [Prevotella sp.]|jgi:uncharacterized protein (TIGR02757 family)|nr:MULTISPECIES: TIGR02757 family protein [unclassified Prevotella]MCH3969418.1 TIGR02757 family protein [Prevotella sp.]MCH4017707.1 TIGR02757 family protein [Prevotella sp.]MCH4185935.1 TIGR02757 family protein [Prevotella sp.]MCH4215825.1 TIGR02757 family protein [Prevotella sp.]MCH4251193.1 TIGR02757 family protein [Prevotella sp.]
MKKSLRQALVRYANYYESEDFLEGDPSWFMHQVTGSRNQEVMAFIASSLSYGSRKQFMPKIRYIMVASHYQPYDWLCSGDYADDIPDNSLCYYRLYTNHTMYSFLGALKRLYEEYGSLYDFVGQRVKNGCPSESGLVALKSISDYFNRQGISGIVPHYGSTCKRLCMFLRWMCRDHSPVDLGLWSERIDKRSLFIPLDTHVLQVSRDIGLIHHKTANWSTVVLLTKALKQVFPDDPMKGDFALFGYGIHDDKTGRGMITG